MKMKTYEKSSMDRKADKSMKEGMTKDRDSDKKAVKKK